MTNTPTAPRTIQLRRRTLTVQRDAHATWALLIGSNGGLTHVDQFERQPLIWLSHDGLNAGHWFAGWGPDGLRPLDRHETRWRFKAALAKQVEVVVLAYDRAEKLDEVRAVMAIVPAPREWSRSADDLRHAVECLLS